LTNEIHLTLTEWKPIPYIFPIRTTVCLDRGQEDRILTTKKTREKNPEKNRKNSFFEKRVNKDGVGDCNDTDPTDKAIERDCGRGCSRQKGQGDPGCGWVICE
jgi:hypothetical protein